MLTYSSNLPQSRQRCQSSHLRLPDDPMVDAVNRKFHDWQFIQDHVVRGAGPTAVQSKLGYLLSGPLQLPQQVMTTNLHVAIFHCTSQYPGEDMRLWNSDSLNTTTNHLDNTFNIWTLVCSDGTHSLRFPWKESHPLLSSNLSVCSWWTRSMAHRLARTPELLKQYGTIIAEQERKSFIEWVPEADRTSCVHYIPGRSHPLPLYG